MEYNWELFKDELKDGLMTILFICVLGFIGIILVEVIVSVACWVWITLGLPL